MTSYSSGKLSPTIFLTLLGVLSLSSADIEAQDYKPLTKHGSTYPNACLPEETKELQGDLNSKKIPEPDKVWVAVELILCSQKNKSNLKRVSELVTKKILAASESTGDAPQSEVVGRTEKIVSDLMAAGQAWDAGIRLEEGDVVLRYFADEACVKSARLTYTRNRWLVSRIGEACD
jgi:hypothetical protein